MNAAIGKEDALVRQWSAANASIEGNESVMERNDIKSSRNTRLVQTGRLLPPGLVFSACGNTLGRPGGAAAGASMAR